MVTSVAVKAHSNQTVKNKVSNYLSVNVLKDLFDMYELISQMLKQFICLYRKIYDRIVSYCGCYISYGHIAVLGN